MPDGACMTPGRTRGDLQDAGGLWADSKDPRRQTSDPKGFGKNCVITTSASVEPEGGRLVRDVSLGMCGRVGGDEEGGANEERQR